LDQLLEIAQGLVYLHSQDIIHGDLRGANILVDDNWHVRLADFGLAVFASATVATGSSHRGGSARWMSPELLSPQSCGLEKSQRTFASDVYSFACVCIEVRPIFISAGTRI
jgi:serine/threonine protein kinase